MRTKKSYITKRGPGKRVVKKKPGVATAVRKYVKSAIHRNIENKQHVAYAFNQTVTGPNYILSLMPNLNNQGTGESQRVGNLVNLRNASMRFIINQIPYSASTNPYGGPIHFRWLVVSQKKDNSQSLSLTNFFEVNNGSTGITATHLNQLLKINDELFKVHKQGKFRLGNGAQSNNFPVAGSNFDNSKLSLEKTLYFGKYITKKMRFDDLASGYPTNTNLWFVLLCSYANGSSTDSYTLANLSYVITHEYEDA